jgi:hypothetical protein
MELSQLQIHEMVEQQQMMQQIRCEISKLCDSLMEMYLSLHYLHAHQDLFLAAQLGEREQSLSHGQLLHYFLAQHLQVTQHVHGRL